MGENILPNNVKSSFNLLKDKYNAIREADSLILEDLLEHDEYYEIKYQELTAKFEEFYSKYNKMQEDEFHLASKIAVEANGNKTPTHTAGNTGRRFKLPVIELKLFNGEIREGLGFWA